MDINSLQYSKYENLMHRLFNVNDDALELIREIFDLNHRAYNGAMQVLYFTTGIPTQDPRIPTVQGLALDPRNPSQLVALCCVDYFEFEKGISLIPIGGNSMAGNAIELRDLKLQDITKILKRLHEPYVVAGEDKPRVVATNFETATKWSLKHGG